MGAIAGFTIFLGLPLARARGVSVQVQGFLNAIATGVLLFLIVEILGKANGAVLDAMSAVPKGGPGHFAVLLAVYMAGLVGGLLGLVWFNRVVGRRLAGQRLRGPGAAVAAKAHSAPTGRGLAL